jgi:primosomal protein N' (replication factor Y)
MSLRFAAVALPQVPKPLTYRLESSLADVVVPGSLVRVPLARGVSEGIVVSVTETPPTEVSRLKSIYQALYPQPVLTDDLLKLMEWMASYYACSLGAVVETFIPSVVRQGAREKVQRSFVRILTREGAGEKIGPQQKALLEKIDTLPSQAEVTFEMLKSWNISPAIAHSLVKKKYLELRENTVYRRAYNDEFAHAEAVSSTPPELMNEQKAAVDVFSKLMREKNPMPQLLHGVTGSGKTEVYLRLIQLALDLGGSALLLVPEVALTPQMIGRLRSRFMSDSSDVKRCVVWHSHLSEGERIDAYRAMMSGECRIVVGARSALFSPLQNLKLIVVDEEHEMAYKQEEAPRYHARDAALMRAKACGCLCVLGSATPSLESIFAVRNGEMGLQLMLKRIDDRPMPSVHVVDLRRSLGKTPWFSTLLKEKLIDRLEKGEQALLFLNRRGHSTSFLCQECGYVALCHQCSIAMTFHADINKLRCHLCGYEKVAPMSCPDCGSQKVRWRGVGTQKIHETLTKLFPKARVARVDSDALKNKNTLREIFANFRTGKLDILVGTQMIAKGLDFPNVTLVGLIDADLSLHQPDFRAAERTFQLLVQVAGRAGRGDMSGEVVVQTFLPHSSTLQYARHVDYDGFVEEEMGHRKEYGYPPYRHLISHLFRAPSVEKLSFYCEAWAREVTKKTTGVEVRGPTPAPIERIEGMYRYQIWYLCERVEPVLEQLTALRKNFVFDKDISDTIDVDASSLM